MENFNLKKFLVENKLTTNSKMLREEVNTPAPGDKLKATSSAKRRMIELDPTLEDVVNAPFIFKHIDSGSGDLVVSTNAGVDWIFPANMFVRWR